METKPDIESLVEEATFQYTIGNETEAITQLKTLTEENPDCFNAWHALAEISLSAQNYHQALEAGLKAVALEPENVHINTSLSRIYMKMGDRELAEKYGAQARTLGWKETLKEPNDN